MLRTIIGSVTTLCVIAALATPSYAQDIPAGYALVPLSSLSQVTTQTTPAAPQVATISDIYSVVRASEDIAYVDEEIRITVALRDAQGAALAGRTVLLTGSRGVEQTSGPTQTNANGEAVFRVSATTEGLSTFAAIDQQSGTQLGERARVVFLASTAIGGDESLLGASLLQASVTDSAADTSTVAASVFIQPQFAAESVRTNEPVDLTVYITDVDGNLQEDFTGTVTFTSSDSRARLPAAHTFTADQRGMHTFFNAITFSTAGEQTVTVSSDTMGTQAGDASIEVRGTTFDIDAPIVLTPYEGLVTNEAILVSGSAVGNTNIAILADGQIVSSTESDASGSFAAEIVLADGPHELTVGTVTNGEQIDVLSDPVNVTVDTTPPIFTAVRFDPVGALAPNTLATAQIDAEAGLASVQLAIAQDQFLLFEIADGLYEGEVEIGAEGDYLVGTFLVDEAGNETWVEDAAALRVEVPAPEVRESIALSVTPANTIVNLSWDAPDNFTDISYYVIRYGTSQTSLTEELRTPDAGLTWDLNDLNNDTQYYFRVDSYNTLDQQNGTSALASGTPQSLLDMTATPCSTGIALSWAPVAQADVVRYEVAYGIRPGQYAATEPVFAGTSHQLRNLIEGVTYYITLRGLDETGRTVFAPHEEQAVTVAGSACHFAATQQSDREYSITLHQREDDEGNIFLSWNPVPDATSYRVYAGTEPNAFDLPIVNVDTPYFRPTGLAEETTYYFAVKAVRSTGHEAANFSNVVELEVGPPLALLLAAASALGGGVWTLRRRKQ